MEISIHFNGKQKVFLDFVISRYMKVAVGNSRKTSNTTNKEKVLGVF